MRKTVLDLGSTSVEGKLYLKMHNIFMTRPEEEGKTDMFMTIEQIEGDE